MTCLAHTVNSRVDHYPSPRPSDASPRRGLDTMTFTYVVAELTESILQVVLCREQHLGRASSQVTERSSNITQITRYVRHLRLQLRERCRRQQQQHEHQDHSSSSSGGSSSSSIGEEEEEEKQQ